MAWVLGIDGARQGWVVVALRNGRFQSCLFFERFADAARSNRDAEVIGVDIPLGLVEKGVRDCDVLAREFVGVRRNSVFVTPPRAALQAPDYKEGLLISNELNGAGFSRQAWGLREKIFEVEEVAAKDQRIFEVHPEVGFAAMNGEPLRFPKRSWNGQMDRRRLLANNGVEVSDDLGAAGAFSPDDILDAAAAAWTASRILSRRAQTIPPRPDGAPAIWF